jgi:DNA-binding CsgD family transcriptional regulator
LVCIAARPEADLVSTFSTLDDQCIRQYQRSKLAQADPCLAFARRSSLPGLVCANATMPSPSAAWLAWTSACELDAFVVLSFHGPGDELVVAEFGLDRDQLPRATTHWISACTADALLLAHVLHYMKLRGREPSAIAGAMHASERELQCLALASLGQKYDDIAERLHISVHTVRFHLRSARTRLKSRTLSAALAVAMRDPHLAARIACYACALGPCVTSDPVCTK